MTGFAHKTALEGDERVRPMRSMHAALWGTTTIAPIKGLQLAGERIEHVRTLGFALLGAAQGFPIDRHVPERLISQEAVRTTGQTFPVDSGVTIR